MSLAAHDHLSVEFTVPVASLEDGVVQQVDQADEARHNGASQLIPGVGQA
jgi:hypothetical protein